MERIRTFYLSAALLSFNFFVLFVGFNLILLASFRFIDRPAAAPPPPPPPPSSAASTPPPVQHVHDTEKGKPTLTPQRDWESLKWVDMAAFEGLPKDEVDKVLDESGQFARQGYAFKPWVQFAPIPFAGTTLNVEAREPEFPYRRSVLQGAMPTVGHPRVVRIYVFGGSTTFGIYVADAWTFASYLWSELQKHAGSTATIELTNFGRPYYYSSQEVALFERLLKTGHRPDVAVFVDGLNDCFMPFWEHEPDSPMFTTKMAEWINLAQFGKEWLTQYRWIPMVRFAYILRQRLTPPAEPPPLSSDPKPVLNAYRENVRIARVLGREYGTTCYFFWQPVPFYHYDMDLSREPFGLPPNMNEIFHKVYEQVQKAVPDSIFLADAVQQFGRRKVFVDNFHYSPEFNRFLAHKIAEHLVLPAATGQ